MLKVASGETLGNGAILWFQNPETNDFEFGIDGPDNESYVSWHAVREGVVGFPTVLNHFDLWLNYKYKRAELEGFANLRDNADDGWDYKEKEVLGEYNEWKKSAIYGRISSDLSVLNMINPTTCIAKSQHAIEHLVNHDVVTEDTVLYLNNYYLGPIGSLFKGENPVFKRFSSMFISAQAEVPVPATSEAVPTPAKNSSPLDAKLLDLLQKYKSAAPDSPEQKQIYQDALWTIVGTEPNDPNSYYKLIVKSIYGRPGVPKDPDDLSSYIAAEIGPVIANYFLTTYDPNHASNTKISSFIAQQASWAAKNIRRRERNRPPEQTEYIPGGGSKYEREDEKSPSRIDTLTTDRFGNPRETSPEQSALTNDAVSALENLNLDSDQVELLKDYMVNNLTLEQIGQKRGLTKERIRQILNQLVAHVQHVLGNRIDIEHIQQKATKQVFLSTAHKSACEK